MQRSGEQETRAGYVALVGPPNAGKSTLLNHFLGEHLSIVTPKAQTTWQRVTGILTESRDQLIFLDTPGLLDPRDLLQRSMRASALAALEEADVVVAVVDARYPPSSQDRERLDAALSGLVGPLHFALNKCDAAEEGTAETWEEWARRRFPNASIHRTAALSGAGTGSLLRDIRASLPRGPFLYPEDEIASQPVRFFVEELVRETVFEQYEEEIPYSVVCRVGEFREDEDPVYIQVDVHVERASQKGILIGKRGRAIRALGGESRRKIEHFLQRRVYLDLWVKPLKSWRRDRATLGRLGFQVPEEDG